MKSLTEFMKEELENTNSPLNENEGCGIFKKENEEEECERCKKIWGAESEEEELEKVSESIKDEKSFRDYAENKFKIVFGDKLDKEKMNKTIDGILSDNEEDVKNGEWGKLVGILNKSFGV